MVRHDSRDPLYRMPAGARPSGSVVTLRCRADDARAVTLRMWWDDGEIRRPMTASPRGAGLFEVRLTLPEQSGLLWYYFIIDLTAKRACTAMRTTAWAAWGGCTITSRRPFS